MQHRYKFSTVILTIFLFGFCQIVLDAAPGSSTEEAAAWAQWWEHVIRGDIATALEILGDAQALIKTQPAHTRFSLLRAQMLYISGRSDDADNVLRRAFEQGLRFKDLAESLPGALRNSFKKIEAEYWFSINSRQTEGEKEFKVIERQAPKPRPKKKSKLLLIASSVLVAGFLMTAVFAKRSDTGPDAVGTLILRNYTNFQVWYIVENYSGILEGNSRIEYSMDVGAYSLQFWSDQGDRRTIPFNITQGRELYINFTSSMFNN